MHTTGIDIKHNFNALAAVTIGKDTTWRDHAQGCYRMRGIKDGQRLNLLIPPQVVSAIAGDLLTVPRAADLIKQNAESKMDDPPGPPASTDKGRKLDALQVVASWLFSQQLRQMKMRFTMLQYQDVANIWRSQSLEVLKQGAKELHRVAEARANAGEDTNNDEASGPKALIQCHLCRGGHVT